MLRFDPRTLACPIVAAPMAGGPSTPALASAVSTAGGLGFLAAGDQSADGMQREIGALRSQLPPDVAFGVNVFSLPAARRTRPRPPRTPTG